MAAIIGIGVFFLMGAAFVIADMFQKFGFLIHLVMWSILSFALLTYLFFLSPVKEPVLPTLGVIAIGSVTISFFCVGAYWIQRMAVDRANQAEISKRNPGQYY